MTPSKPVTPTTPPDSAPVGVEEPVADREGDRLALLYLRDGDRGVLLHRPEHVVGDVLGEPADVGGLSEQPVDTLLRHAVARTGLLVDEAVLDQLADVLADGL
jgi:hypothetical protein